MANFKLLFFFFFVSIPTEITFLIQLFFSPYQFTNLVTLQRYMTSLAMYFLHSQAYRIDQIHISSLC